MTRNSLMCALAALALLAAAPAGAQYRVLHGHFCGGSGVRGGGSYVAFDSAAQPLIGIAAGTANTVKGGFWYCAEISSAVDVAFAAFAAELRDDAVVLAWEASASVSFEGFHVYRSETDEGALARITAAPLPAVGDGRYRDETALAGRTYLYRIGAIVSDGGEWFSPTLSVSLPPRPTTLYQNYPNPFNPATSIAFYLAADGRATLVIYDVRGARVRGLVDGELAAGRHVAAWDGRNDAGAQVGSGVYYYRLQAGKDLMTKKLVIVR
ncbi:MAG: FlgD immunoglobulin-like domain containing protein [Candidatus Krumholzibacteria bacterium]|nr:FlgD immunoglobulin-like domain containing protein [Candidatus Krumholzibacteria bacterium]